MFPIALFGRFHLAGFFVYILWSPILCFYGLCVCVSHALTFFCFISSSNETHKGTEWEGEDGRGEPGGETMITYIV